MSTQTVKHRESFNKWKERFSLEVKQPGVSPALELLLIKGCTAEDLESALYFAVDCVNSADEFPEIMTGFAKAHASVLRDITLLNADLATMLDLQFASSPFWVLTAWSREADVNEGLALFSLSQTLLPRLEKQVKEMKPLRARVKSLRSALASSGEVWLQVYVESITNQLFRPQVSVLLQAAAGAYGRLKGSVFTEDAVSRRYSRFRDSNLRYYEKLRQCLEEFKSERKEGKAVELIPFLISRLELSRLANLRRFAKARTLAEKMRIFSEIESR